MNVQNALISYFVICIMTRVWIILSEEYYIKDGAVPSYFYNTFYDINGDVFPEDISINTSMSTVRGTLLYSLDKNMNQLIVSLRDGLPHVIDIELNKQNFSVSLSSLCGCERCRYEILELRIQINSYINIQCNGGNIQRVQKINGKQLNENYPIIYSGIDSTATTINGSTMWLVNTPKYDDLYPNRDQMCGCIFHVSYNERPIKFTNVTSNIEQKCTKTCFDNICNGGQCYETYGLTPICNCTQTFLNGQYCNDPILPLNANLTNQHWMFSMFKLSWKSSINELFELKNGNVRLSIWRKESHLFLEFISYKGLQTQTKVILTNNYVPDTEYVCVGYFFKKNIDIRLLHNGSWTRAQVPIHGDLRSEIFESITLRSGDGYIDMVHRDYQEYKWRKVIKINYTSMPYHTSTDNQTDNKTDNADNSDKNRNTTIIIAVVVVIGLLIVCITLIVFRGRLSTKG